MARGKKDKLHSNEQRLRSMTDLSSETIPTENNKIVFK